MRRFEKCKTATENTRLPQRSTEQAAGYDFYSPVAVTIGPHQWGIFRVFASFHFRKQEECVN